MSKINFMSVTFFLPNAELVEQIKIADPERDWRLFSTGVQVWIGQTYLRLKRAGYDVILSTRAPSRGTVVAHADHVSKLLSERSLLSKLTIVSARADRPSQRNADIEVVQNRHSSDSERAFHIQHWPQPGLIPRDPKRRTTIENVAFKGAAGEMATSFTDGLWELMMARLGVAWRVDAAQWTGNDAQYVTNWNDYSDTDVVVAVRKDMTSSYTKKPASKLINAWLAGVPAVLGREEAYRELRRTELDYIEVTSAADAFRAIETLKNNPQLYDAMVRNGSERAAEVTAKVCTDAWADLLFKKVPKIEPTPMLGLCARTLRCRVRGIIGGTRSTA
ncbi:hypothetical protein NX784_17525 [Massilia pinisoli]|uniref:Glycosyl transferase family 1 n=1 Tax=Massilia pinisoli TaxID=1772194 RepID=A0ABT1ZU37_9BURK|nr:hypothetical protein [Massilia pinisoli]MCS0583394.1 hypothetical protein [Massilia pinisoli]